MDIHAMMQRQERLCLSFAQEMYSQLYALGKEIHVRGIPDPFQMRRSKRKFGDVPETYSEMLRRRKEENYDLLLDGSRANVLKTAAAAKVVVCNLTNLLSNERSDYLQVRCGKWYLPELADKAHALQYTPVGLKIFEHWQETGNVYYLRRNYDRFMAMQPLTKEQYEGLKSGDVDGFVFPVDHSTDGQFLDCLLYTSPSPRDKRQSRMPSSA